MSSVKNHSIPSEKEELLQLDSSNPCQITGAKHSDIHLAAVMHAAEGGWLLSGTQLVHTDWAVGSWAWRMLGIFHLEPRGDEQRFTVLYITLDQKIHIPPAVH